MARVPHVYIPGPWAGRELDPGPAALHHLRRVLRLADGREVTYTDGEGLLGRGELADAAIVRGPEDGPVPRDHSLVIAVAPPRDHRRARFIVEKLGELGCAELVWLRTERGEAGPPSREKCGAWAVAALEQSKARHLLAVSGPVSPHEALPDGGLAFVADRDGAPVREAATTWAPRAVVLVGPEGGFVPGEVPADATPITFGAGVLRVETAAISAAAIFLGLAP